MTAPRTLKALSINKSSELSPRAKHTQSKVSLHNFLMPTAPGQNARPDDAGREEFDCGLFRNHSRGYSL